MVKSLKNFDFLQLGSGNKNNNLKKVLSNFKNNLAIDEYDRVVEEVGEPDYIVNKINGIVVWNNPEDGFVNHILKDEHIEHCVPANHVDFLYTTIKYYIPEKAVSLVQSVSGSVLIDLLKNEISARCGSTAANYATLRVVIETIKNFDGDSDEIRNNISNLYSLAISKKDENKIINKKFIQKEVKESYNKDNFNKKFHPYSFPLGCPN